MLKSIVTPGDRFGILTVLRELPQVFSEFKYFRVCECACDCGVTVCVRLANLRSGNSKSCGCVRIENTRLSCCAVIPNGSRFGMLTVIGEVPIKNRGSEYRVLDCLCDCGRTSHATVNNLASGRTTSCGCFMRKFRESGNVRRTHGMTGTPELALWLNVMTRCLSPFSLNFKRYGGRGITICERWRNPVNFRIDIDREIGPRPGEQYSLDRKDNDRGYEPGNVKWSTAKQQARNTRRNVWVVHNGARRLVIEVCEEIGFSYRAALLRRSRYGYTDEELFKPLRKRKNRPVA